MSKKQSNFRFERFYVNHSSFNFKETIGSDLNIDFNPLGNVFTKDRLFQLNLNISLDEGGDKKKPLVVVDSTAEFRFEDDVLSNGELSDYFLLNAPAIVFPYIRAYISTITIQSGLKPILLPTFNLSSLSEVLRKNITIINK